MYLSEFNEGSMQIKIFCALIFMSVAVRAQDLHREYYKNNTLRAEGLLSQGVKEGEWKYYYPSGVLMGKELLGRVRSMEP